MKLDFIPDGPDALPMVRLFDFKPSNIAGLLEGLSGFASGANVGMAIHALGGVEAFGGARLFLRAGMKDKGMVRLPDGASFECALTPESWDNVAGLVEPFRKETKGFQWLVEMGDGKWLLSVDGQW